MSAVIELTDLQPVVDLLERLQNVQRAMRDLHDAQGDGVADEEFSVAIMIGGCGFEKPVANTYRLSHWVVLQGLAAMERELRQKLEGSHEITVESVLPIKEGAAA